MKLREQDIRLDCYRTNRTGTLMRITHLPTGITIERDYQTPAQSPAKQRAAMWRELMHKLADA